MRLAVRRLLSVSAYQHRSRACCRAFSTTPAAPAVQHFLSPSESATRALAGILARECVAGDCYCLFGAVGAGKSAFSRAFVRAAADDEDLPVPSPTYLLQNIYDELEGPPIHHFDLYRLGGEAELGRLALGASFGAAVSLVEWAERLGAAAPTERLHMQFLMLPDGAKECCPEWTVSGCGEAVAGPYEDMRWRLIRMEPYGRAWQARAAAAAAAVAAGQGAAGQGLDSLKFGGLRCLNPDQAALLSDCMQAGGRTGTEI